MKTKTLFFLLSLLTLISGCSKQEPKGVGPSSIQRYPLLLSVQDVSGNDRVMGIGYDEKTKYVESHLYQWNIVGESDKWIGISQLALIKLEEREYLLLTANSPKQYKHDVITHILRCPHIFGDNTEREITLLEAQR